MAGERVIICGAGGIIGAWSGPIKEEGLQVVAVVDLKKEAAEQQIAKFGFTDAVATDDLDRTLQDFRGKADFLIDLTIPDAHCGVTCKALEAGLPVLGEKPMAATMQQARQMVATAEKTGKLYMVAQSRRWWSNHASLAATLRAGAIGTLTTLNCDYFMGVHIGGFREQMASPLILDMAIHHFDMARMFSGQNALSVYAEEFNPAASWYKGDVSANCLFEMTGGVRFAYRGSWCAEGCHTSWNGDWRAIGTRGTLLMSQDQMPAGQTVANDEGFFRNFAPAPISEVTVAKEWAGELKEFLHCLRTGATPQTECHDNIHSLAMVFAAIESSRTGRRVKLSEL